MNGLVDGDRIFQIGGAGPAGGVLGGTYDFLLGGGFLAGDRLSFLRLGNVGPAHIEHLGRGYACRHGVNP